MHFQKKVVYLQYRNETKVKPKKQHIMNSHVIYTYNERDIKKKGRTFEANSVTGLIDACIAYTNDLFAKASVSPTTRYHFQIPHINRIHFHAHTVDVHGYHHHCHFTINGSPSTLLKARKHFESLGINKR